MHVRRRSQWCPAGQGPALGLVCLSLWSMGPVALTSYGQARPEAPPRASDTPGRDTKSAAQVKKAAAGSAQNQALRLEAVLHMDRAEVARLVGAQLDQGIVVLEVTLTPLGGKMLAISRDDFLLRCDRDGQRATPFHPSQIAGSSVMVVSSRGAGAGMGVENNGPVWGGIGGGRPGRLGGDGTSVGSTNTTLAAAAATHDTGAANPALALLEQKILPEKETTEAVSGQLYFLLEGKQKVKDLELIYKGAGARLPVRFQP